jgi:chromate transporter
VTNTPSLLQFALVLVRIGLTSFGGGMSGWMLRVMVQEKRWIAEPDFLAGLGLCQVLPGINVVNLAVWLGYRFHGGVGALLGACAIVVPPGLLILLTVTLLTRVADDPWEAAGWAGALPVALYTGWRAA